MPVPPDARKAIQALREIQELAIDDIERQLGGVLPPFAAAKLRYWIAQAYDEGRKSPCR